MFSLIYVWVNNRNAGDFRRYHAHSDVTVMPVESKLINGGINETDVKIYTQIANGVLTSISSKILTHWGRVTHICVSKLTIIDSDNGLSPDRRQANIWTNDGILLIGPFGTNFSEILIEILTFSFKKMRLKVSSAKRRPFCLGLNVLRPSSGLLLNSSPHHCPREGKGHQILTGLGASWPHTYKTGAGPSLNTTFGVIYSPWLPNPGIILGMGSGNESRRYNVTSTLIGWAPTQNAPATRTTGRPYRWWSKAIN